MESCSIEPLFAGADVGWFFIYNLLAETISGSIKFAGFCG